MENPKPCYVFVNGEKVDVEETQFVNIEEDISGRDLMTFTYKGKEYKSFVLAS
jgi:hypothetical protein